MKRLLISLGACCLAGCADDTRSAAGAAAYEAPLPAIGNRLAVLGSDYKSASLSLLAADTQTRIGAALWHSGSEVSASTTALSGDVALGQTPLGDGRIVIVDRGSAVISFWDPVSRDVAQIPVSTGFYSNPQDAIPIAADKLYVVRMKRNPEPTANPADFDEGDDVLIVDPRDGKLRGRIDLAPFASEPGLVAAGSRAVRVGNRVWLPLQSIAADFGHQGPARIALLDTDKDQVILEIAFSDIKNCVQLQWLPDAQKLIGVCPGAYSDKAAQGDHAGIVVLSAGDVTPTGQVLHMAKEFGGATTFGRDVACTAGGHCLVATSGDIDAGTADTIWRFELQGGAPTRVGSTSGPFAASGMVAIAGTTRVLVGDRTNAAGDVRIFDLGGTSTVELPAVRSAPGGLGAIDFGVF